MALRSVRTWRYVLLGHGVTLLRTWRYVQLGLNVTSSNITFMLCNCTMGHSSFCSTLIAVIMDDTEWSRYFDYVIQFLRGAKRQYGVGNEHFADYVVERLDLCISTCASVIDHMVPINGTTNSDEVPVVEEYRSEACRLLDCLKAIQVEWRDYRKVIDARVCDFSFQAGTVRSGTRGRPRFNISKDQLEYLSSLAFGVRRQLLIFVHCIHR